MANPLLAAGVDIRRWLEDDAETPFETRLERDRTIGRQVDAADDLDRVLGWWARVRERPAQDGSSTGARVAALERIAVWLLLLIGLTVGIGLGAAAFAYDGRHPVNLLALLGILVGVPLLLLLATLIFLLPGRVPGLAALREGIGVINPGRWVGAWLDRFSRLDLYGGFGGQTGFARWQLVVFSQWLALGYFAGVLLAGVVLVAVTDLAFGWSTTLELDAATVRDLFALLALPWQGWLPSAVPDLPLVEASRFYRLETAPVTETEAMRLGAWWPFVLLVILFWGFLPRLVLLLVARWRVSRELRSLLCQSAEVLALLDRLAPPHVDFGPEEAAGAAPAATGVKAPPVLPAEGRMAILIWNQALEAAGAQALATRFLGGQAAAVLELSARTSKDSLAAACEGLPQNLARILIVSKGWEPPLLEFADFVAALRAVIGEGPVLVVAPVSTRRDDIDPVDRQVWAEFLNRQPDPKLYVLQATGEGEADGGEAS